MPPGRDYPPVVGPASESLRGRNPRAAGGCVPRPKADLLAIAGEPLSYPQAVIASRQLKGSLALIADTKSGPLDVNAHLSSTKEGVHPWPNCATKADHKRQTSSVFSTAVWTMTSFEVGST